MGGVLGSKGILWSCDRDGGRPCGLSKISLYCCSNMDNSGSRVAGSSNKC